MTRKKNPFRPTTRAMALEPRLLFDGAAAVAVADHPSFSPERDHPPQDVAADHGATQPAVAAAEATAAHPAADAPAPSAIVIIDASVADYQSLLPSLPANALVRVVQADESGLAAISQALQGRSDISSVQIIGHGTPGQFTLGSDRIDSNTLATQATQDALQSWAPHLTDHADILLYGCDIAQGPQGMALLTQIASLTGADIAASTDPTGAASRGGDWTLEAATGAIEAQTLAFQSYDHLLADTAITDANAATPRTTAEDTPLAISGLTITDADNPASMTLHVQTTGGTGSVTDLGGATVTAGSIGSADFTLSGSMAQINTALATLQYTPDANKNSSTSGFTPKIDLTATDVSNGGSGTLSISNIAVTAVNDAPDLSTKTNLTVSEGGTQAFSLAQLASSANALDVDILTGQQVIAQQMVTITSLPTLGTLSYNGGAVKEGSVIPVTSLGNLTYTHNGADIASNTTDSFGVTVSDGGGAATDGTLSITITPKNVAPTVSGSPTLIEGQVKAVAPTIDLGDSHDTLANATIVIDNIDTGGQGTLFIDANGNNVVDAGEALSGTVTLDASQRANLATQLKFFQNGAEPNAPGATAPSYQIHVTDAGGGEGTSITTDKTITLTVQPNNDDPTLINAHATTATALSVVERVGGSPVILTAAMLKISDVDRNPANTASTTPADQLVYTIGTPPTQGEIQLYIGPPAGYGGDGWITLGDGGRFTQADVDASKVRYYQTTNVTGDTPDSFTFTVRDSAFGYDVWTNPANPTGGREGGLRDTPTGAIATQSFHINVTANATTGHDTYEGDPRPATPGYGGGNMTYHFVPAVGMTNGNGEATWNEANVAAAGGGYAITSGMLSYTITRTDNMGTLGNTADDISVPVPPAETVYTLTVQPPNGTVERNISGTWTAIPTYGQFTQADINAGNIRFVHDGSENHTASFGYTVSDGTPNHYTSTFALNITPTNDRPTASGGTAQVMEGNNNAVRLDGSVIGMSDVDLSLDPAKQTGEGAQDFLWFQITDVAKDGGGAAHGTLQRWSGSAWVNVSTSEWLPSTLLTASIDGGTSGLRYVHDGSEPLAYSGGPNLRFSYVVRDDLANPNNAFATNTSTPTLTDGSAQSNQSVSATATIQVIPVNNAPLVADKPGDPDPTIDGTITDGGALAGVNEILANVPEGGTATITSAHLTAIDPDNTTVQRQYRITAAPTQGVLQLNGATLGVGSTFTQTDIDNNRVTYKHNGMEVGEPTINGLGTYNDKFHFVVNDGVAEDSGNAFLITLTPTNDKPTLTAPTGPIDIDSANADNNKVTGFSIADPDLTDGRVTGETDFVQATVRILNSNGTPIADYATGFASGGVSIGYATDSGVTVTRSGTNDLLQIQGTRQQVNDALAGLSVTFANDTNARYKLEVIVDDRLRNGTGVLSSGANGGGQNQATTPGGAPTAVPATNYDWTTDASPTANDPNLSAATVDLRASSINQAPIFTGPTTFTVNEDVRSKVGDSSNKFVVEDAESTAFGTPVTVTVSVPTSQGVLHIGDSGTGTSKTPAGGQAVAITGQGTRTLTLTGRADDIEAVLNGRNFADSADDSNTGLYYTSASNANHDQNAVGTGDVTLTLTFNESTSAIGGDVGSGSVENTVTPITTGLTITAINDAPSVAAGSGNVAIAGNSPTAVPGFVVNDVDATDGYVDGEMDGVIQVTVRVTAADGTPLPLATGTNGGKNYADLGISISTSATGHGATVDSTLDGSTKALELRGTREQINAYLAGLQVQFANLGAANLDGTYSIEVIADDRLRDAAGALSSGANGGANNQQTGLPAVPSTDTFDAYATKVSDYNVYDVVRNTRPLFISSINDPGDISANDVTVNEGAGTLTLNAGLGIADPDDNGATTMTTTVTVSKGTISAVGGAGGSVSGLGTNTITITGATEAQINSRLQLLTIAFPDESGAPTPADWNGNFTVTVVYNDNGNTGTRPDSLTGDTNAPAANPGDYDYVDAGNALKTTRTFTVTVNPVNDAPTRTDATPVTLPAATEDTDGGSGDTVSNLFGGKFSDALDGITGGSSANTFAGIAITTNIAIAPQGKWQYSTNGGSTWSDLPTVSANSALLLDTSAKLRFDPAADFHGTPGGLNARLVDSSGGAVTSGNTVDVSGANAGGSTRYSDAGNAVTLTTTVSNVNDRPTGADATLTSIPEDSTNPPGATVASLGFGYADATDNKTAISGGADASTSFGGIAIVGNTANASTEGVWYYSIDGGSHWIGVGIPADNGALILPTTASLRFVPVANYNGTPGGLTVRVADSAQVFSASNDISATVGDQTGTWSAIHTLGTTVTPLNDAPTLTNTATNPTVTENTSTGSGTSIDPVALLNSGTLGDIDLTTTAVLSAPIFGAGTITVALTDGVAGDVLQVASGVTAGIASTSGGTGNTPLVITLANAATVSDVEAILAAIQYKNTSDNPTNFGADTTRSYSVVLNDGNNVQPGGNAGGPAALNAATINGTITLVATNDPPVGEDNSNSVTEDAGTPATGNVITDGTPDHDPDNTTAELSVSAIRTGTEIGGGTAGTLGTPLAGQYGSLTIGADGSYSYALDNTNPAVNALLTGQTLTETFTYTVRDPGGLTDTAQITITIHGHTDGGPSITPVDGNAGATGQATVHEHGLTSGGDTSETTSGTISITAADGLAKVTINGTDVALSALNTLGTTPVTITTAKGTLTLTSYASTSDVGGVSTAGTLSYSYTLAAALSQPGATESTDVFALGVTDQSATSAAGTLTVQIIDDVPTATADTHTVTEGATLTVAAADGVLKNDSSGADGWAAGGGVVGIAAGDTGTPTTTGVGTVITGSYGTLTLAADGSYTYTTTANSLSADATDVFTYTVQDGDGDQTTATLTIRVQDVTLPSTPVSNTVNESGLAGGSTAGTGHTIANASLGLPSGVTAVATTGTATYGSYTVNADGTYSYTLTARTTGDTTTDSFTYTARDTYGNTVTNTVTITIVDDMPTAKPDTHAVTEDTALNASGNVLTGTTGGDQADTQGADGASVTGVKAGTEAGPVSGNVGSTGVAGSYGTLTLGADGSYDYALDNSKPAVQALGVGETLTDTFTYTITDGDGDTSTTTLTITIHGTNDAPQAVGSLPAQTGKDSDGGISIPTEGGFTDIDGDTLTYTATGLPPGLVIDPETGIITGTLDRSASQGGPGHDGVYTVSVTANDGHGGMVTQTFTYTVTNPVPTARDDTRTTAEDTPVSGNVISGSGGDVADSDPDGDPLQVTQIVVGGQTYSVAPGTPATVNLTEGTLVFSSDGSYTFTPTKDWNGIVPSIGYTISDAEGGTASATLHITVTPVVDIADDSASTRPGTPVTTPVLGNDSFENPDQTVTSATDGAHGKTTINPNGTITYTPNPGYVGNDSYTYTVTSGGVTETATVTVNVMAENPPLAVPPFSAAPPAPPVDSLQPRDPLVMSPVVSDPGVFFAGGRSDTVLRLPIPLHPITYVEGAVEQAQLARTTTDPLLFSNPAAVRAGEVQSTSIGAGLGFDPVVYVTPAVRDSQALRQWLDDVVDGRLERLSLSSDREIPTPDLAQPDPQQLVVMPQEADKPHTEPAEKPTPDKGHKKSADAGSDAVEHAPRALRAAPSFSDQLRVSLKRPVATLYPRFNGH